MVKWYYKYILKAFYAFYLRRTVTTKHDGFKLSVSPSVFHPTLFFSTLFLYERLQTLTIRNKKFLELGSGSGLLSLLAFRKGAFVTAIDINEKAVADTQYNFDNNFKDLASVKILQSDLFLNLPVQLFDVIIINPPYFFKAVSEASQLAWNCGAGGEYFHRLFQQLPKYADHTTLIWMSLADNCDIAQIKDIASQYQIKLVLDKEKIIKWEKNFIFKLNIPVSN